LAIAFERHRLYAKHALGYVIVRLEHLRPVLKIAPLRISEELGRTAVKCICIDKTAAADARAAGNEHILKGRQIQDATQAQPRRPQELA